MKKFYLSLCLVFSLVLTSTGCDKMKTLKQLEDIATEMRVHNKSVARVTNEFHAAGKLSNVFHLGVLTACDKFSKTLDGADKAIDAAKLVTTGTEGKSALDYAQRFLDTKVFTAFTDIVESVTNVPPEVKAKIEAILASIRLLFAAIRTILSDAGVAPREENYA